MKILTRYVIGELLRSFVLAMITITAIFVLFMVMAEATRAGLSPREILRIIPFIIPSSVPYTLPVSLLFAASVVYGRMASDNEVVAIKTAGLNPVRCVLLPAWLLGAILCAGMVYASAEPIPLATHQFRLILFRDLEDMLYKTLKKEGEFDGDNAPFYISVRDVEGRTLIGATFKHRKDKQHPHDYDLHVSAERARIKFDVANALVRIELENSETTGSSAKPFVFSVNGRKELQYPLSGDQKYKFEPRIQELTDGQLAAQKVEMQRMVATERRRQAVAATMWIGSGRLDRVAWPEVGVAWLKHADWGRKVAELETERQLRRALALGTFLFLWLGAPVGIFFARRDFLSAFISCFLPIIVVYYPLVLAGVNLAKEGSTTPLIVYTGDAALALVGLIMIRKVRKH